MEKLTNIHPGEILSLEFLEPLRISAYRLSKDLGIPQTRISEITKGRRRITADTALRLSKYFGNSAQFWLGLQNDFDIEQEGNEKKSVLEKIQKLNTEKRNGQCTTKIKGRQIRQDHIRNKGRQKELNKTETEPKMPQSRTQRNTNPTKIRDAKEGRTRVRSTPEKGEAQEKKRVVGSTRKIEITKKHNHAQ